MLIGDRLRQIRENLGLNQKEFSLKYNLNQQNLSNYELGKREISDDFKIRLLQDGVNIHWLLTGNGEMFIKSDNTASSTTETNQPENTDQIPVTEIVKEASNEKELIKYLSKLLAESQQETEDVKNKYEKLLRENATLKGIRAGLTVAVISDEQKKIGG